MKTKFLFSLLALVVMSLFAEVTLAQGGWISSGGELFKNGKNPWFVKNTAVVNYCIRIDESSFSASKQDVQSAIQSGFKYWKNEFSKSISAFTTEGVISLATQDFVEKPCPVGVEKREESAVDIEFLFGYGTLSTKQIAHLVNPKKYIGVTVRTDYDVINLKAKGFVFISSDLGTESFENAGNLIDKAWTHPKILQYAVLHELGHVFGIPHTGSGLMSEVFLDQILNKNVYANYEKAPIEAFLRPNEEVEVCDIPAKSLSWFSANDKRCIGLYAPYMFGTWKVFAKKDANSAKEEIGEIRGITPVLFDHRGKPVSILQITDEQTVFTPKETLFRSFMYGPFTTETGLTGTYTPNSRAASKSVYINMTPTSITIQGMGAQSKVEPVFIFNSPLSVLMLISPTP